MVNFRYHLVSLVAVFLALGIGVLMGATVIDRGTLRLQKTNLERTRDRLTERNADVSRLEGEVRLWDRFAQEGRTQLLDGRLSGVPVMVVTSRGVDTKPLDELHGLFREATATDQGTLSFTTKLRLASDSDLRSLAGALQSSSTRRESLRRSALEAVAQAFSPQTGPAVPGGAAPRSQVLVALRNAGFLDYQGPVDLRTLPVTDTHVVVVSGDGADVADDEVAIPFLEALAGEASVSVVAAEPRRDGKGPVFVGPVRKSRALSARVSTVDDLESFVGQVAAVLAVAEPVGSVGHYGVGPGAQRLLPNG